MAKRPMMQRKTAILQPRFEFTTTSRRTSARPEARLSLTSKAACFDPHPPSKPRRMANAIEIYRARPRLGAGYFAALG